MFFYAVTILFALQFLSEISSENCTAEDNGGCSQLCTNLTDSYFCHCRTGYLLEQDNRTCVDDDECRWFGKCSHFCENQDGGFRCSCRKDGYLPDPSNNTRCIAQEKNPTLLVYQSFHISKIALDKSMKTELIPRCKLGFSFHFKTGMLFWKDADTHQIFKTPVSRDEEIPVGNLMILEGEWIIDWIHHNIYYWDKNDFDHQTLKVTDFEGKMEKTLLKGISTDRYDQGSNMALDPEEGWIFWINGLYNNTEIERVGMDGSRREIIISNVNQVRRASAITLDLVLKRVFWSSDAAGGIFCSRYDGSNILFSVPFPRNVLQAESLAIFEDWIYFTDLHEGVHKANKFTGELHASSPILPAKTSYLDFTTNSVIQIYHPTAQPDGIDNCPNAKCSHLCLGSFRISDNETYSVKCACPDGLRLDTDQATCVDENNQVVLGWNSFENGRAAIQVGDSPDSVKLSFKMNGTTYWVTFQAENLTNSSSATP